MNQISEIIKANEILLEEVKAESRARRKVFSISPDDYKKLFSIHANRYVVKRDPEKTFVIDKDNRDVMNQLYYWLIGSEQFDGKLSKGILLMGNFGNGKSLMLTSLVDVINDLVRKKTNETELLEDMRNYQYIKKIHSKRLASEIRQDGIEKLLKRPLMIDDLGKEPKEMNDYGTIILPVTDLLALRYDECALTFATANFKESFKEYYGETIYERMIEMFNFIEVPGESRRKE